METQLAQTNERPAHALEDEPIKRSIGIGLACTVLFHLLLLLLSPRFAFDKFAGAHTGINVAKINKGKSFDFQLDPGIEEKKPDPIRFVETNPNAPENIPDKTSNFSDRNQQSAQKDPTKEKDPENRPSVKGQDKIKNDTAIVTGDMSKPQQGVAARPEVTKNDTQQQPQNDQKVRAEQTPLTGFDKKEGLSEDGIATNISKSDTPSNQAQQEATGAKDGKDADGGLLAVVQNSKPQPKARPKLSNAMPSIVTTRTAGTSNAGFLGIDARWSEYGEYLHQMEEIIVAEWYRVIEESRIIPPAGSHVIITFKITPSGETTILKVEDVETGKQGVQFCRSAIQDREPYRKWTEQMIATLGDEQVLTFGFYYQ